MLTNRNKKKTDFSKLKNINLLDLNEAKNKQNYTYNNKDILFYGKKVIMKNCIINTMESLLIKILF